MRTYVMSYSYTRPLGSATTKATGTIPIDARDEDEAIVKMWEAITEHMKLPMSDQSWKVLSVHEKE